MSEYLVILCAGDIMSLIQNLFFFFLLNKGDIILGGLHMVHEREDTIICGPVMAQGGIQALETMLYTLDYINQGTLLPNFTIGAHVLDDCDKGIVAGWPYSLR